jgi:hypothetical protein
MRGMWMVCGVLGVMGAVNGAAACPPVEVASRVGAPQVATVDCATAHVGVIEAPLVSTVPVIAGVAIESAPVVVSGAGVCAVGGVQVQTSGVQVRVGSVGVAGMSVVRPGLRLFPRAVFPRTVVRSNSRVVVR